MDADETNERLTEITLRGEVLRNVFTSPERSFAIIKLLVDDRLEKTLVGPLAAAAPGQFIEATGKIEQHSEYGEQLRVEHFRFTPPTSREGLKRYLSSGAIPGIGPTLAERIINHFGNKTLEILDHFSARLSEVPKVGKKKAAAIANAWKEQQKQREIFIFLQGLGITPGYCARLYDKYGDETVEMVREAPYKLAEEVDGIGFLRADEIARSLGIENDSIQRLTAGAVFQMGQLNQAGHVGYPEELFVPSCAALLQQDEPHAKEGVDQAVARALLIRQDGMIYTPILARAERELPKIIKRLRRTERFAGEKMRALPMRADGPQLNSAQQQAVESLTESPLVIITGGPGVGKTTVVGEIVRRAAAARCKIALAAPTGRAARRMSESTNIPAKTIHRLLEFDPKTGTFAHNANQRLSTDILIVDECSMIDIQLAHALFRAVEPGTSVVLVGDADQLPSVGPGTVLASFLASGLFCTTHLTEVFRQREGSLIIQNAHRVNQGFMPLNDPNKNELCDFYWIDQDDPDKALEMVGKLVGERIPIRFGLDPRRDIQVLAPMHRGSCGTVAINEMLQKILNNGDKPQFRTGERVFKSGDKVMQNRNNYDRNTFNGDLGRVGRIDAKERTFEVWFDGRDAVEYSFDDADELTIAYAITVHKSQGSEFPAVIVPMLSQHYMMLQRNLLYTAMTRAKKLLILIGGEKAISMAVRNTRLDPRYTHLTENLLK